MIRQFAAILFIYFLFTSIGFSQSTLFKDFNPSGGSIIYDFFEFNGEFYFIANNDTSRELWKSDGTLSGTQLLKHFVSVELIKTTTNFTIYNGELYFSAYDFPHGTELWKTNGTSTGTTRVSNINPSGGSYPTNLIVYNSELYFNAINGYDKYLYKTNGTSVTKVSNVKVRGFELGDMIVYNSELYFGGQDSLFLGGLYKTNGTAGEEILIKQISKSGVTPYAFALSRTNLIFIASDINEHELWITDGTEVGTQLLKDINPSGPAFPSRLTLFKGKYYFSANDGVNRRQLWKTNGTTKGTKLVKNIIIDSKSEFAILNSQLFFAADDGVNGIELWKSNGTKNGTVLVKNIHPSNSSNPLGLTIINNRIYFGADNGSVGAELWKSDGTRKGTVLVQDILTGKNSSNPTNFFVFKNNIFFNANDSVNGNELWKYFSDREQIIKKY